MKIKIKGGKVIASGGFGCVFKSALKCKGSKFRQKNKISKLMTEKHALSEFNEIQEIRKKIDKIEDYKNYFLVDDFTLCIPDKLTISDLEDYKKKCTALPKDNITEKNINNSLDKLRLLNMPDGGVPVDDYIYDDSSFENLYMLNKSLISLLINGIIPMNKLNIYHCDIKDSNVLVDDKYDNRKLYTRLIDWGLSTEYVPFIDQKFPKTWRNRPLQFNVPFSVILFTDKFVTSYKTFINSTELNEENIRIFVKDYISFWMKERGSGHYKFINELMYILFSNELQNIPEKNKTKFIESNYTIKYITNYLVKILLNYTYIKDDGNINMRPYLDKVFINIVDIWGFILVYYPVLEFLYDNYEILDDNQLKIFNLLKSIFIRYLYEPRIEPINIKGLVNDLEYLGDLFKEEFNQKNELKKTKMTKTGVTGNTFVPNQINNLFDMRKNNLTNSRRKNNKSNSKKYQKTNTTTSTSKNRKKNVYQFTIKNKK
jgi:hypothetical protein